MNPLLTPRFLYTGNSDLDNAYRLALADIQGNVVPFRDGLLDSPRPCLMAGLHYGTPWTRDTSINAWNGAPLLIPEAMRNTLLSVLVRDENGVRIGGQYWDAIVWVTGAWAHYLYTGDREFLALAFDAARNSLNFFERTEFDPSIGLFRGGACFMDGVAGYPDRYVTPDMHSGIDAWVKSSPRTRVPVDQGLPVMTLSTNCLYYNAYVTAVAMARELDVAPDPAWLPAAHALRDTINRRFWSAHRGSYAYLLDPEGVDDRQEGLGIAFAVLFGIADADRIASVIRTVQTTRHGIACLWPQYERYAVAPEAYGRHGGTVWPHVNAFWADAAATAGHPTTAFFELSNLAHLAVRDLQFAEIYHPDTGAIYGGVQEDGRTKSIRVWVSRPRQTWCATGYLRMVLRTLLGATFSPAGIRLAPWLPEGIRCLRLNNIRYRNAILDIRIEGRGSRVRSVTLNGRPIDAPSVPASAQDNTSLAVTVSD